MMIRPTLLLMLFALLPGSVCLAENIVFPEGVGVINVKTAYGAAGDGKTDDTAAIQKAIDEEKGKNQTLYFPNGTYLISDSVGIFGGKPHSSDRFLTFQGQSEAGTIIKLNDGAEGFDNAEEPKIVLSVYQGQSTGDVMHSYVRNLTVDVGSGNPGAAGLRFLTHNTGAMERVTIRSSDPEGAGAIGLDLRQSQIGPCMISHITVEGLRPRRREPQQLLDRVRAHHAAESAETRLLQQAVTDDDAGADQREPRAGDPQRQARGPHVDRGGPDRRQQ